ncbi:MAG: hypothetical protein ACYS7M_00190, partial [Planctomycetota bacterium]
RQTGTGMGKPAGLWRIPTCRRCETAVVTLSTELCALEESRVGLSRVLRLLEHEVTLAGTAARVRCGDT